MGASQDCGLGDPPAQLDEHDGVESDRAEFCQENPDVVSPQSVCLILFVDPALPVVRIID